MKFRVSQGVIVLSISLLLLLSMIQRVSIPNDYPSSQTPDAIQRNIYADLIEIDYLGINGNEELLQLAEEHDWPGTGKEWDPIIIEGYYFRNDVHNFVVDNTDLYWVFKNNVVDGVDGRYCSIVLGNLRNARISDNVFVRGAVGIHTIRVTDCEFIRNTMYNLTWDGVLMETSHRNIIMYNTFYDMGEGGVLAWTNCNDNNIISNVVYNSTYGIMLYSGSDSNTIQANKIYDITSIGIEVQTSDNVILANQIHDAGDDGICISGFGCEVKRNLVYNTSGYGVHLFSLGGEALIQNNVLINNEMGGIQLHYSSGSRIIDNDIIDNGKPQAWDFGNDNVFRHNYWHEWIGNDTDNNTIIDTPKVIEGGAENTDSHPSLNPINTLPSWYDFVPITGPPSPEPEPEPTTTTPETTTTHPVESTTVTSTEPYDPPDTELFVPVVSVTSGILVLFVVILLQRRYNN